MLRKFFRRREATLFMDAIQAPASAPKAVQERRRAPDRQWNEVAKKQAEGDFFAQTESIPLFG